MSRIITELIQLIRQEQDVLERFLKVLEVQKKHLLANQIDEFQGTVSQQESVLEEIRTLEEKRIAIVRNMAQKTGMREDEITLTHLIETTLGDVSSELKSLKKRLSDLVERIRRVNRINQLLIKRSLNFIQQSIDWMIDTKDITQVYDFNGRTSRQTGTSVMVNKVF